MTIPHVSELQDRIALATPLTYLQHGDIHKHPITSINAIIDYLNAIGGGSGGPVSSILAYAGPITDPAPLGYLWADGRQYSKITYADLYNIIGTTYNVGGRVGPDMFCMPDLRGVTIIGANPMSGTRNTDYSARVLATKYGAESYTNNAVAVTGNTPAMSVSFSNMGHVTFPTFDPGAFPTLTGGTLPSSSGGSFPTLTGGVLPSSSGGVLSSLSAGAGNITSEAQGTATVSAAACIPITAIPEGLDAAAQCTGMTVDPFTVDISKAAVFGALDFDPGSFPTFSAGSFQALTGGGFPTFSPGSFPTLTSGTLPSQAGGSNSVTGIVGTVPSTALSGVVAAINVPTVTPSICLNYLIKY